MCVVLRCSPGIAAAMARVHSYEWVQDALLEGPEDDDGKPASRMPCECPQLYSCMDHLEIFPYLVVHSSLRVVIRTVFGG